MGAHVANSGDSKIYFVVDPTNPRETGALAYPNGHTSFFNFWGWISANPEITKLQDNEFQQLLWDEPLPQDEEMWDSIFFSRTMPLSGIIDPKYLVNIGGGKPPTKQQTTVNELANQVMKGSGSSGQR